MTQQFTPPGYVRLSEMVRDHGADEMRNRLSAGDLEAFRYEDGDGSLFLIRSQEWNARAAAGWLTRGQWNDARSSYREARNRWVPILVRLPEHNGLTIEATVIPVANAENVYLSPFMEIMLRAIENFNINANKFPKKEELVEHFKLQKLPDGSFVSPSQAAHMATFCRPFEAMKGGQKRVG